MFQGIFLFGSIVYALVMISQSAKDWTENPVIISTDNVEEPIRNLPFPSLSVCKKDPNYHKSWQVPEVIYNFIDVKKTDPKVQELLANFSNFTERVTEVFLKSGSNYSSITAENLVPEV